MKQFAVLSMLVALTGLSISSAWIPPTTSSAARTITTQRRHRHTFLAASAIEKKQEQQHASSPTPEETTEKYGLEAGLFQSLKQKTGAGESAKSLLKRYGIAYLATSIPLALMSFALCYVLVDNGVDVAGLFKQVGIENNQAGETAGTFALAYAAHKAASPIRFPPTVLLTPVVAKLIGKDPVENVDSADEDTNTPNAASQ